MSRKFLSFFFSLVFVISIALPTISYLCDDDSDNVVLIEKTEEENKESEITEDAEVKFLEITKLNDSAVTTRATKENYHSQSFYSLSHNDVMNPPPESA